MCGSILNAGPGTSGLEDRWLCGVLLGACGTREVADWLGDSFCCFPTVTLIFAARLPPTLPSTPSGCALTHLPLQCSLTSMIFQSNTHLLLGVSHNFCSMESIPTCFLHTFKKYTHPHTSTYTLNLSLMSFPNLTVQCNPVRRAFEMHRRWILS